MHVPSTLYKQGRPSRSMQEKPIESSYSQPQHRLMPNCDAASGQRVNLSAALKMQQNGRNVAKDMRNFNSKKGDTWKDWITNQCCRNGQHGRLENE
jgi:hypothetical protein